MLIPLITQYTSQAINEAASQAAGGDNKNRLNSHFLSLLT